MEQATLKLPIRLAPRRGMQAGLLLLSVAMGAFALYWIPREFGESQRFVADGARGLDYLLNLLPPLIAGAFLMMCAMGIFRSILKLLPGSPYYHLALYPEGLVIRAPFRRRRFGWNEIAAFETIEVKRSGKYGPRYQYFTVARAAADAGRSQELLRVHADEYGGKKGQEDADTLTAWLNALRQRGIGGGLKNGDAIEIPEGFRQTATPLTPRPQQRAEAAAAAVPGPGADRRPTVERQ